MLICDTFTADATPPSCPQPLQESSLEDPAIASKSIENQSFELTYQLVEEATKRGKVKLIDSQGYNYNVKRRRGNATDWQCTVRPKINPCRATVVERNGAYKASANAHNHPADVGAGTAADIMKKVKSKAMADILKPASAIVDEVRKARITLNFFYFSRYRIRSRVSRHKTL